MLIDLSPLKNNRDFRYVFLGHLISFFGTMLTFVAIPYQMFEITQSTLAVGIISLVELVPLLATAFIGGALADTFDRRKLVLWSDAAMMTAIGVLVLNSLLPSPQAWVLYIIAAILSALSGFHRPAIESMLPRLVQQHEIQAASILRTFKFSLGMIGGMAASGILISTLGIAWTFFIDFLTFCASLYAILQIKPLPSVNDEERPSLNSVKEAFRYAGKNQEILGTYLVDFIALVFSMPVALLPALSEYYGGPKTVGWLYAAPAIGTFIVTLFSGWAKHVKRHGAAVICAAFIWGAAIVFFGIMDSFLFAILFLIVAGAADGVSGMFRLTIWNETIPDKIRGRMAGLEMIGYTSGPLLGNAQAGLMASFTGIQHALIIGGSISMIGVVLCCILMPKFWGYHKDVYQQNRLENALN